jgi:hypothetical protein
VCLGHSQKTLTAIVRTKEEIFSETPVSTHQSQRRRILELCDCIINIFEILIVILIPAGSTTHNSDFPNNIYSFLYDKRLE